MHQLATHLVLKANTKRDADQRDYGEDDDVGEGGRENRPKEVGGDEDLEAQNESAPQTSPYFVRSRWRPEVKDVSGEWIQTGDDGQHDDNRADRVDDRHDRESSVRQQANEHDDP